MDYNFLRSTAKEFMPELIKIYPEASRFFMPDLTVEEKIFDEAVHETSISIAALVRSGKPPSESINAKFHLFESQAYKGNNRFLQFEALGKASYDYTSDAAPWPDPPSDPLHNRVGEYIKGYPDIIRPRPIQTINPSRFRALLKHHPNQRFVESIMKGLDKGFWLKTTNIIEADGEEVFINPHNQPLSPEDEEFLHQTHLAEWTTLKGDIAPKLTHPIPLEEALKYTRVVPQFVVRPTDPEKKVRPVNDFSHPRKGNNLNSFILDDTTHMDYASDLIQAIAAIQHQLQQTEMHNTHKLIIRKFDVKRAFRQIGLHPISIIKNAILTRKGISYDQCLQLGAKNAGIIFGHVAALLCFILRTICGVAVVLIFVDDIFGVDIVPIGYNPTVDGITLPLQRICDVCSFLGILYSMTKVVSSDHTPVLGIGFDMKQFQIYITMEQLRVLDTEIRLWIELPTRHHSRNLQQIESLAGWLNWMSAARHHIIPFISPLYGLLRIAKQDRHKRHYIPQFIVQDLIWIANHLRNWTGQTSILRSVSWKAADAHYHQFTDAALQQFENRNYRHSREAGIGIWWPTLNEGLSIRGTTRCHDITALELFGVYLGLFLLARKLGRRSTNLEYHIACWTDNLGAANCFNSRRKGHNNTMKAMTIWELAHPNYQVKTHWIERDFNQRADDLSKGVLQQVDSFLNIAPDDYHLHAVFASIGFDATTAPSKRKQRRLQRGHIDSNLTKKI